VVKGVKILRNYITVILPKDALVEARQLLTEVVVS